jgi:hypothetical protein
MSLVDPDDDILTLADGTRVVKATGVIVHEKKQKQKFVEVPSGREAQEIVARTRRSIAELPLPVNQMNILSVVLTYTLFGLSDVDIGVATNLTLEQIKNIKKLPEYKTLNDSIMSTILDHEANDVRSFFKQKAMAAAQNIVAAAEDDGVLGFKASQDILDRAGFRPADVVEHKHSMENALRIEYIRKTDASEIPALNITPGVFDAHRT